MLMKIVRQPGHHFWSDEVTPTKPQLSTVLLSSDIAKSLMRTCWLWLNTTRAKLATLDGGVVELIKEHAQRDRYVVVVDAR